MDFEKTSCDTFMYLKSIKSSLKAVQFAVEFAESLTPRSIEEFASKKSCGLSVVAEPSAGKPLNGVRVQ